MQGYAYVPMQFGVTKYTQGPNFKGAFFIATDAAYPVIKSGLSASAFNSSLVTKLAGMAACPSACLSSLTALLKIRLAFAVSPVCVVYGLNADALGYQSAQIRRVVE